MKTIIIIVLLPRYLIT